MAAPSALSSYYRDWFAGSCEVYALRSVVEIASLSRTFRLLRIVFFTCDATSIYYDFPLRLYHRAEYLDPYLLCLSSVWRLFLIPSFSFKFVILVLCTSPLCCILEYLSDQRLRSALPDLLFALLLIRSVLRDLFGGGIHIPAMSFMEMVPGYAPGCDCPCGAHIKKNSMLNKKAIIIPNIQISAGNILRHYGRNDTTEVVAPPPGGHRGRPNVNSRSQRGTGKGHVRSPRRRVQNRRRPR